MNNELLELIGKRLTYRAKTFEGSNPTVYIVLGEIGNAILECIRTHEADISDG
jgi:hypothetical protein